jgi:hypothetical protein
MAHLAVETAREIGEGKDKHEREDALREFRKCAMTLHNVLSQDGPLDEAEFLFVENRFQVLEMAYHLWKWEQRGLSSY